MEYIWISCYKNKSGEIVADDLVIDATKIFQPFPPFEEVDKVYGLEHFSNESNFRIRIEEESISKSGRYYSKAALCWNIPGSASWDPLAHVCVTQEETDEDIVVGYHRKYAITKEMRQNQAYTRLIEILTTPTLMKKWICEHCSNGCIPQSWACKPF